MRKGNEIKYTLLTFHKSSLSMKVRLENIKQRRFRSKPEAVNSENMQ